MPTPLPTSLASPGLLGAGLSEELLPVAIAAAAVAASILLIFVIIRQFRYICRPHEALIISGGKHEHGARVILGRGASDGAGLGGAWRLPFIERIDRLDMRTHSIDVVVQNAYSAGNIPLAIHAIANVKIHSDSTLIRNAIERFLDRSNDEVRLVARQTLEGALREVLAQMTPEQVNEDRLTFADHLGRSARDDLDKLGLQLDTLKIQSVTDDTGYLNSLGRPRIAAVLRDAENAENQAQQEITEAEAAAGQTASVAKAEAETAIVQERNDLDRLRAEQLGELEAVTRAAAAAATPARAVAEQELQEVRSELEGKRLLAEVILPAEAQRQAASLEARGHAAPTIEDGKAVARVLDVTAAAWAQMGPDARELYVLQHLEQIVDAAAKSVRKLRVGEVNIIDPGDGSGIASYAATFPKTVAAVLSAVRETTGVDVPAMLARDTHKRTPSAPLPSFTSPSTERSAS
ncbi:MAG: SPFH domain-containing protein [Nannocystaceae bacterium]